MAGYWIILGGTVFVGWVIMKATTPNKEEFLKVIMTNASLSSVNNDCYQHMSPSQLESQKKKNEKLNRAMIEHVRSNEPIWKIKYPTDDQ